MSVTESAPADTILERCCAGFAANGQRSAARGGHVEKAETTHWRVISCSNGAR